MRGYGSADMQSVTEVLSSPDWGWGDPEPTMWDVTTQDYGWGSDHGPAFPSYLELDTTRVGDDGGYRLLVRGDFPRLGASDAQRPTGFSLVLDLNGVEYLCYAGRVGEGVNCSTDLRARILTGYTPLLDEGYYSVLVRWENTEQSVGTMIVERRMRTTHEYHLRDSYPSAYAVGARRIEIDEILDQNAPSARDETHTNLYHLTRSIGQSLAEFCSSGVCTRITQDLNPTDNTIHLESTLGMTEQGGVYVGGVLVEYAERTKTTLTGLSRPRGQIYTIPRGEILHHDPHVITN